MVVGEERRDGMKADPFLFSVPHHEMPSVPFLTFLLSDLL